MFEVWSRIRKHSISFPISLARILELYKLATIVGAIALTLQAAIQDNTGKIHHGYFEPVCPSNPLTQGSPSDECRVNRDCLTSTLLPSTLTTSITQSPTPSGTPIITNDPVQYHGGRIITSPVLVPVFVGKQWEDHQDLQNQIIGDLKVIASSQLMKDVDRLYSVPGKQIGTVTVADPIMLNNDDFTGSTDDVGLMQSIVSQQFTTDAPSSKFPMLYFPPTGTPLDRLAHHWWIGEQPYAVIPVLAMATAYSPPFSVAVRDDAIGVVPSYFPSSRGTASVDGTHEAVEGITDPFGDGWYGSNNYEDEVGDRCSNQVQILNGNGGTHAQKIWDWTTHSCPITDGAQNPPFTINTFQWMLTGLVLGGCAAGLGIAERKKIARGAQSIYRGVTSGCGIRNERQQDTDLPLEDVRPNSRRGSMDITDSHRNNNVEIYEMPTAAASDVLHHSEVR